MKKLFILTLLFSALVLPCVAFTFMRTATSIGSSSSSATNPTNAPGPAILGFGGENIQGFGGENINGQP